MVFIFVGPVSERGRFSPLSLVIPPNQVGGQLLRFGAVTSPFSGFDCHILQTTPVYLTFGDHHNPGRAGRSISRTAPVSESIAFINPFLVK